MILRKVFHMPFFIAFLFACSGPEDKTIEVNKSEFTIESSALKDHDELSILSCPGAIGYNEETFSYYICLEAVSKSTLDTINVLVFPSAAPLSESDNVRYFISNESFEYEASFAADTRIPSGQEFPNPDKVRIIKELGMAHYKKYPTVIGLLANSYTPGTN